MSFGFDVPPFVPNKSFSGGPTRSGPDRHAVTAVLRAEDGRLRDRDQHLGGHHAMLGIFFSAKSAVLIEDVPFTEDDIRNDKNPPQNIYSLYNQVGINCFIAAGIYVAVGAISLCQVRLNKRQEYMVT
uniref:Ribonuclease, RNase K b n=1 Tax=Echeneis naucrates TaxID=173247 RepID=A0A665U9C5_ECHNA